MGKLAIYVRCNSAGTVQPREVMALGHAVMSAL